MKFLIVLFFIFFTQFIFAETLNWDDLETGRKFTLVTDIKFPEGASLSKGDALVVEDIGGGMGLIWMTFSNLMCQDPSMTTEMVLVNPEPDDFQDDKSVSVKLDENCQVNIYLEMRHYYNKSLFE